MYYSAGGRDLRIQNLLDVNTSQKFLEIALSGKNLTSFFEKAGQTSYVYVFPAFLQIDHLIFTKNCAKSYKTEHLLAKFMANATSPNT